MEMESTQERRSGAGKIIVIIALILLVAADIFLLYNLFDKDEEISRKSKSIKVLENTRDSLQVAINNMQLEIDQLKKQIQEMGDAGTVKDQEISKLQASLNRMKVLAANGGAPNAKMNDAIKKELAALREAKKRFETDFDALRRERDAYAAKNADLKDSLDMEKKNADKIKKDKGIVDKRLKESQALKADNVVAIALKVKSSGKESPVTKASRVNKVQVAFKVQQNLATDAGSKTIYMRVLGPDKSVITSNANNTFTFDGDNLPYTEKKEIQYENKDTDVKINFKKNNTAYTKGTYTVELYESSTMIGKTTFILK